MVWLRQLAVQCNFGANLAKELLRVFVFGCGIEKVEELMSSNDSKTLKDAIECGLKNEHKLVDLKQIRSAYSFESAPTGWSINHTFSKEPTGQSFKNCGWCGREQHDRVNCPAKDKDSSEGSLCEWLSQNPNELRQQKWSPHQPRKQEQLRSRQKRREIQAQQRRRLYKCFNKVTRKRIDMRPIQPAD